MHHYVEAYTINKTTILKEHHTVYDGVRHAPLARFSVLGTALESSRRELSEDVSFGIGSLLGCRAIDLGKPPQGGVIYCTLYTVAY